jgi:sulfur transfer complex TusBCD TusB component (DsrH family)
MNFQTALSFYKDLNEGVTAVMSSGELSAALKFLSPSQQFAMMADIRARQLEAVVLRSSYDVELKLGMDVVEKHSEFLEDHYAIAIMNLSSFLEEIKGLEVKGLEHAQITMEVLTRCNNRRHVGIDLIHWLNDPQWITTVFLPLIKLEDRDALFTSYSQHVLPYVTNN